MRSKNILSDYDRLISLSVRRRDGLCCAPGCTKTTDLDAHHIFPRLRMSTRLLEANLITLCREHHTFSATWSAHRTPHIFKTWIQTRLGKKYFELEKLSNTYTSQSQAIAAFQALTKYVDKPRG